MARFRRASRGFARPKRNAERILRGGVSLISGGSTQVAYTYTATQACVVRSFKLDVGCTRGHIEENNNVTIPYVMVHVREGYAANALTYPALTDDMYNPTNDVLISGVLTDSQAEDHKSNMIGRKLKAGDKVALIFRNAVSVETTVEFELNFSVLT